MDRENPLIREGYERAERDLKRKNKELKAALGSIIDLASENLLDEYDAKEEPLKTVYKEQQKDMELVVEFYESL